MANQILGTDQSDKQRNTGALIIKVHNELVMPLCENSGLLKKNIAINTGIVFQRKKVSFQALTGFIQPFMNLAASHTALKGAAG